MSALDGVTCITPANVGLWIKKAETRKRVPRSRHLSIVMVNITTKEQETLPVISRIGDVEVTAAMVERDIAALNYHCGVHGYTGEKLPKRHLAFKSLA